MLCLGVFELETGKEKNKKNKNDHKEWKEKSLQTQNPQLLMK